MLCGQVDHNFGSRTFAIPEYDAVGCVLGHGCIPDGAGSAAMGFPVSREPDYGILVVDGVLFSQVICPWRAAGDNFDWRGSVLQEEIAFLLKKLIIGEGSCAGNDQLHC